jgi:hypothetical protein
MKRFWPLFFIAASWLLVFGGFVYFASSAGFPLDLASARPAWLDRHEHISTLGAAAALVFDTVKNHPQIFIFVRLIAIMMPLKWRAWPNFPIPAGDNENECI